MTWSAFCVLCVGVVVFTFCFQTNNHTLLLFFSVSVQVCFFLSRQTEKLLLLLSCLCSKHFGVETKEQKSISVNQKRIASSPTRHHIKHPPQTPSLQSHSLVVLPSHLHGRSYSSFYHENIWVAWKQFCKNLLLYWAIFFYCIPHYDFICLILSSI